MSITLGEGGESAQKRTGGGQEDKMLVKLALPIKEQFIAAQSTSGLCLS